MYIENNIIVQNRNLYRSYMILFTILSNLTHAHLYIYIYIYIYIYLYIYMDRERWYYVVVTKLIITSSIHILYFMYIYFD